MTQQTGRVLVVDDERDIRDGISEALADAGHEVLVARGVEQALVKLAERPVDVVLSDLRMPGVDGLQLLELVRKEYPAVAVLLMTAYASVETAVVALKAGASDYLLKPLVIDELLAKVEHLLTFQRLTQENRRLRDEVRRQDKDLYLGVSRAMADVARTISRVAATNSTVLICGESGTGKDVVARAIHRQSPLGDEPLVVVDLGAIPEALLESQLFGSVKGAFTGAGSARKGLFQAADGGTLFLDEVGNLSLEAQAKLLRAIESGEVLPVGGTRPVPARVRLLAATNRALEEDVAAGTFRQDLYYRLNVLQIHMPPLRERRDDIPGLVTFLVQRLNASLRSNYAEVDPDAMLGLLQHDWPGNVREVQNVLERAMVLGDGFTIHAADLSLGDDAEADVDFDLRRAVRRCEREQIQRALVATGWSRKDAARKLGISTTSLWRRMTELGVEEPPAP